MRRILPPKQPSLGAEFDVEPSRRLFFAIRPDVGATGRLTCLMERLRHDAIMPGRSVEPDRLHITLHHLVPTIAGPGVVIQALDENDPERDGDRADARGACGA